VGAFKLTWFCKVRINNNFLSFYNLNTINNDAFSQTEIQLYGSNRLGINTLNTNKESGVTPVAVNLTGLGSEFDINFIRGKKFFELSNHLGNVLVAASDKKTSAFTGSVFDHYEADIVSAQEYYPFSMQISGRGLSSSKYCYGFNGKGNDNEVKRNEQDYGMRVFDQRIGKFLSVYPLTKGYSELALSVCE